MFCMVHVRTRSYKIKLKQAILNYSVGINRQNSNSFQHNSSCLQLLQTPAPLLPCNSTMHNDIHSVLSELVHSSRSMRCFAGGQEPVTTEICKLPCLLKENQLTALNMKCSLHKSDSTFSDMKYHYCPSCANQIRNYPSPLTCTAQISRVWTPPIPSAHSSHSPLWNQILATAVEYLCTLSCVGIVLQISTLWCNR